MDVRLPDGTVITGVPDNFTKAQLIEKLRANGYDVSKLNLETTVGEDIKIGTAGALSRLDAAQAMARVGYDQALAQAAPTHPYAAIAALAQKGINKLLPPTTTDEIFKKQAEREAALNKWANPEQKQQSFGGELLGTAATLPLQIPAIVGAAPQKMQDLIQKGESVQTAQQAGLIDTALNTAMIAAPAAFGKTLTQKVLTGAGANTVLGGVSDAATRAIAEQEATKKAYDPFDPRRRAMDAILGAGFGAVAPKSKPKSKPVEDTINNLKALNEQKEQQAQAEKTAAEQQAAEAAAVQAGALRTQQGELALDIPNEVDVSGVRNPYDVGGRISDLAAGMETTIDSPQLDLFAQGLREQVYNRPDIQAAELALLQAKDRARSTQEQGAINRELEAGYRLLEQDKPRDALGRPLYDQQPFLVQPGGVQEGAPINLGSRVGTDPSGIPSLEAAMQAANQRPLTAAGANPSMYPMGGPQMGMAPSRVPKTNLKDATANLMDAIASATGAKQNFLKDGGIRTAAKDFVNALWDAGSRKWSEVLAKGRELFGDTWRKIGQVVKAEWDSFVRYQKAISAGKAGSFATSPFKKGDKIITKEGVRGTIVDLKIIPKRDLSGWYAKRQELHDQAFQGYMAGQHTFDQATAIFDSLVKKNEDVLRRLFRNNSNEVEVFPKVLLEGQTRPKTLSSDDIETHFGGPKPFVPKGQRGAVHQDLLGITKALNMFSNAKTQISRAVDSAFSSMEFPKSPDELKAESFKAIPGMKDAPYVAKDPVFENEKPNILAEGKDGGRFWFMTPGRLMAQELRNSNLIKTVGRLFENARNRAAYYNRTVLEPIKREVKRISANDNEVILLRDIMHMELKNGKPFTPDELLAAGVSPELSGVLQKMRAAYADVLAKENAARVEAGLKPITALDAYYASRWVGPWTAEVRLKAVGEDGKPYSKLVYFIRERSKGSLNNAIEWVKQKHPELEIINNGYDKNYSLKKGRIEAGYEAMLQILGPEDPLIKDIDAWMKERATQTTENVLGQEKHFKAKGGKLGYAGSRPWVDAAKDAREFLNQQLQYIENGYIWSENQAALREMKKYTSDADILKQQPNNVEYVKELAKLELGQGTIKEIDALENWAAKGLGGNTGFGHMAVGVAKSIFYLKAMGLSVPYIVVSLLQPALVLPPAIIHAKGSFKDAIPALADGPYVLARTLLDDYNYKNPKLNELVDFAKKKKDPFVEEAYRYARDNQVTEVNPLDEIRDPANTSGVPRSIELANKTVGATISLPEIAPRSFVYMSFVHGLRNKFDTSTPEGRLQLFEKAAEMTGFAMGVYRKEQKAPIYQRMGMVGNALSTLQTFPLTYMAQGLTYYRQAKKGNPVPLLAFMGTTLMMTGATGLIGLDDAIDLYNFVKRWILTPSQYAAIEKYPMLADPKGWLVKNTPDWVSYGPVSSLTGTNLFTRTTMGDVVQFGPFESSTTNIIESMFPFVAELYKTGEGAWDIGVGVAKGDMKRIKEGGYAMTPSGLRGLYEETVPGFREGTIIKRPSDLKVKQVDRPLDEAEKRMLGFRSMREQKELDLGFANRTQEELRAKQYKNASDSLLNAIYNQKGIPDAFETWVALGGDPRNLNQVQKRYILNSTATKLQQDAMKARSNSPAERRKAQQAIEILNELQR